jgi:hypothetical protein
MYERRNPFRGWITENRTTLDGVETIIVSIRMSAKLNLTAEIAVEVVGHTADSACIHRCVAITESRSIQQLRIHRSMGREVGISREYIDPGNWLFSRGSRRWGRTLPEKTRSSESYGTTN